MSNRRDSMSDEVVAAPEDDNVVDALAAVALVAVFVVTCVFWVATR
ncbi:MULTISPECIES: hypothetical protein [unclassified Microbulbifer]|uniref:Uncharacterized protein n=1 Tax=Microbulbifer spongiae TaxID=2944933 RepID=A0ABY9E8W6_9GAMM|nr:MULTISPECIES: hypothetical protein [unclassified Microbulbifer]MDP5209040.1 hypothetical protein [Microbulbifer sp. 2205BS26-8]WKD48558.1 hypothetical protein M8T91_11560 [Microbulbifer sp. MI-G]